MRRINFVLLLVFVLVLVSCQWFRPNKYKGYGVVLLKRSHLKDGDSCSVGGDSAVVINFSNGYRQGFGLKDAFLLGSVTYSERLQAFGYEGVDNVYRFVGLDGQEVLSVSLPFTLSSVRLDDENDLLMGIVSDTVRTVFFAYNYSEGNVYKSFDFSRLYAFPLCTSAYSPEKRKYYFFYHDTALFFASLDIDSGFIHITPVSFNPIATVYNHRDDELVIMINSENDTVLPVLHILRFQPDRAEILSEAVTELDGMIACAAGFDYDKNAVVVYDLVFSDTISSVSGIIRFIDPVSGQTVDEYYVDPDVDGVVFWRD